MLDLWKLKDFDLGEGVANHAYDPALSTEDWIDVPVPGDVHTALIAAGRIEDPYYDTNELDCAWVEDREWWYRTTFTGPGALASDERLQLVFEGLDTYATVWLNGVELGRTENMFREHVFDITSAVADDNTVAVRFHPPLVAVAGKTVPSLGMPFGEVPEKALMRKAQYGYGWDWGPRLPTIGIWRRVGVRRHRQAAIEGVHLVTETLTADHAHVTVSVEVDRFATDAELTAEVMLRDANHQIVVRQAASIEPGAPSVQIALDLDDPHAWWTHDLGEPYLYTLDVSLCVGDVELDHDRRQVGLRTLELDQSPDPDEPGTLFFRFVLNGVPIFAKGGNWIPADSFVGAIPDSRYARWIDATTAANMNMLRVWGGGIYESEVFFDLCDRAGVLVWHDFMFSDAPYPDDDPAFVEEVRKEVVYQVRRLRNRPSLAAWVGNNECQMVGVFARMADPSITRLPGELFYETLLPEVVRAEDGQTPYWPGSPYGGRHPNDQAVGDVHDWTVWHGISEDADLAEIFTKGPTAEQVRFERYSEDLGRFISEFGMHASPVRETLARVIPETQLFHHSPSMDHHNKDNPKNKGDLLMMTSTGLPADLEEYIDFSMIAQAEGLKHGIEHFRRRKPHCSGTLIWQLNDCWPVLSWAIMDSNGFGKAGYYYTTRVYAPVLASFRTTADGVELWVTNDRLTAVAEQVVVRYGDFASGTIWEETVDVSVPANGSAVVWTCPPETAEPRPDRYLAVRSPSASFPANRMFFASVKDLVRPVVGPIVEVTAIDEHELRVVAEATAYTFFFHVLIPDEEATFSDNYLDLAAGERVEITVTSPSVLHVDQVTYAWR